jgi:glycosyltransferase 2 family protein
VTHRQGGWKTVQLILTLAVVGFAGWYLWEQWTAATENGYRFDFQVGWLLAASVIILTTFAVLIETWRRVVAQLGSPLTFGAAARIWFVSNLGKYVPGRIWALTTMAMLAGEQGVPVSVVGASSVVLMTSNVATGFAVVLLMSAGTVQRLAGSIAAIVAATIGLFVLLFAAPYIATHWNRFAKRFHRAQLTVEIPAAAILMAIIGTTMSWFLYGLAFMLFVRSIIGTAPGPYAAYVTANAASYLVGYLMIIAPAGIGFREVALATILPALGIATRPQGAVIAIASRIWLTVLEIAPSLLALLRRRRAAQATRSPESPQSRGSRIP